MRPLSPASSSSATSPARASEISSISWASRNTVRLRAASAAVLFMVGAAGLILAGEQGETPALPRLAAYLAAGQYESVCSAYNIWTMREGIVLPLAHFPSEARDFCLSRGFQADEVYSLFLEPKDVAYLQRISLLKRIARSAAGAAGSPHEIARRLFAFVTREIAPRVLPDSYERPEDILVRGYGSCDQACWALVALAEQMGLPGMVIFLRDPKSGSSPHTIASLQVEEKWLLFDPFAGRRFHDNRDRDLDLAAALREPRLWQQQLAEKDCALFIPEYMPWASFLVYTEARGCLPRWSVFAQALGISHLRLWFNPVARQEYFRHYMASVFAVDGKEPDAALRAWAQKSFPDLPAPPGIDCRIYGEPFQVERRYADRDWLAVQQNSRSQGPFRSARLLHLAGLWNEALRIFEDATPKNASEAEDLIRYRALTLEAIGRYEDAIACQEELEKGGGFWSGVSAWHIYQCLQAAGRKLEAAQMAERIREPRRAQKGR